MIRLAADASGRGQGFARGGLSLAMVSLRLARRGERDPRRRDVGAWSGLGPVGGADPVALLPELQPDGGGERPVCDRRGRELVIRTAPPRARTTAAARTPRHRSSPGR